MLSEMSRNTLWVLISRYGLSWQNIRFEVLKQKANAEFEKVVGSSWELTDTV